MDLSFQFCQGRMYHKQHKTREVVLPTFPVDPSVCYFQGIVFEYPQILFSEYGWKNRVERLLRSSKTSQPEELGGLVALKLDQYLLISQHFSLLKT